MRGFMPITSPRNRPDLLGNPSLEEIRQLAKCPDAHGVSLGEILMLTFG
jgi:hypothetical protein